MTTVKRGNAMSFAARLVAAFFPAGIRRAGATVYNRPSRSRRVIQYTPRLATPQSDDLSALR